MSGECPIVSGLRGWWGRTSGTTVSSLGTVILTFHVKYNSMLKLKIYMEICEQNFELSMKSYSIRFCNLPWGLVFEFNVIVIAATDGSAIDIVEALEA